MLKSEQQKIEEAEDEIGFLSDGMWHCTDGQKFHSRRMATTAQMEIDELEYRKNLLNPDSV